MSKLIPEEWFAALYEVEVTPGQSPANGYLAESPYFKGIRAMGLTPTDAINTLAREVRDRQAEKATMKQVWPRTAEHFEHVDHHLAAMVNIEADSMQEQSSPWNMTGAAPPMHNIERAQAHALLLVAEKLENLAVELVIAINYLKESS